MFGPEKVFILPHVGILRRHGLCGGPFGSALLKRPQTGRVMRGYVAHLIAPCARCPKRQGLCSPFDSSLL